MKFVHLHELSSRQKQERRTWRWLERELGASINWQHIYNTDFPAIDKWTGSARLIRLFMTVSAVFKARKADLIITHGAHLAASIGFANRILGIKTQHLAWAFSIVDPNALSPFKRCYYRFSLRNIHQFVMFSSTETETYSRRFNIPQQRLKMLHWSSRKPSVDEQFPPPFEPGYIAAIGGEGRDYSTLFAAMRLLPQSRLVVVASPESVKGLEVPDNVELLVNMPPVYTFRIAHHAKFMVLPTCAGDSHCGHSTIVFQFLLGKATIVTESVAMIDYVKHGVTALSCRAADVSSLVESIKILSNDEALLSHLASNGEAFARKYCTEAATVSYVRTYLRASGLVDPMAAFDSKSEEVTV